jgi:hypothetical protein
LKSGDTTSTFTELKNSYSGRDLAKVFTKQG